MELAHKILMAISKDELLKERLEAREKFLMDQRSAISYYRTKGLEEGEKIGREEGERTGRAEAKKQIGQLIQRLAADGRTDEIVRMASDLEFQEALLEEYGL